MTHASTAAALAARIEACYRVVAAGPMADVPLCNPRLAVRVVGLVDWEGLRVGAIVMPWAINLLLLPGETPWPATTPLSKRAWRFPSGDYDFVCAEDLGFGPFQVCSLFSPALEFESMAAACDTAAAALAALLQPPRPAAPAAGAAMGRRRWLTGARAA